MLDQMISKVDTMAGSRFSLAAIQVQNAVANAKARFSTTLYRVRNPALGEEGQGLTEYIIGIVGVITIGAAVFVLIRTIAAKYGEAGGAIDSLPVSGGW